MEEKNAPKQQKGSLLSRGLVGIGIVVLCLGVSVGVAALVVQINRAEFGVYLLPFALSVWIFLFSTFGFFLTEGKKEVLYGICSIGGAACAIVQMALIF